MARYVTNISTNPSANIRLDHKNCKYYSNVDHDMSSVRGGDLASQILISRIVHI